MATISTHLARPRVVGRSSRVRFLVGIGLAATVLGASIAMSVRGTQEHAAATPIAAPIADRHDVSEFGPALDLSPRLRDDWPLASSSRDLSPRLHDDWPVR